jgi:hypothetical protein
MRSKESSNRGNGDGALDKFHGPMVRVRARPVAVLLRDIAHLSDHNSNRTGGETVPEKTVVRPWRS